MRIPFPAKISRAGVLLCAATLAVTAAFGQATRTLAPTAKSIISLVQDKAPGGSQLARVSGEASFDHAPANFHSFATVQAGETGNLERLKLRFSASTTLTRIESTKDFVVEQGGSCVEGKMFAANETCVLRVRFNPQGAGRRLGRLTITHTASPEPENVGLGGYGYAPVVSFTPAVIATVPGTFSSGAGLLSDALGLATDGGDTLYIADTGNSAIRYVDSSGAIKALPSVFGIAAPAGIAVDNAGNVYFTHRATDYLQVLEYAGGTVIYDSGSNYCAYGATCGIGDQPFDSPGGMATDPNGNVFLNDEFGALSIVPVPDDIFENAIPLYLPYNYPSTGSLPIAVDAGDNIYSYYGASGTCAIFAQSYYNAETIGAMSTKVAGGRTCGFSGDGGQARNAEINGAVGQMAFDVAGNFYFTDTANQRVRRIDYSTGIINTIAGTGTAGYTGDSGSATNAELSSPTGVAVDSQGQVYIISSAASGQVVRKLGTNGILSFSSQVRGTASAARTVTVSNTGNAALTLTSVMMTGTDPGDFSIDPTTTSCNLAAGSTLDTAQSCKIGILFKPAAGGSRSANLVLLDNTVTNSNTVQLSGTGTLPAPTFTITSPASGASEKAGKAVTFKVSVTSSSAPAPTGTVAMTLDGTAITGSPATLSSGAASLSVKTSVTGPHMLAATYSGDANYAAAGPISEPFTVSAASAKKETTTTKLKSSVNPAEACKAVTFTATVDGKGGPKPTGDVELWNGSALLVTATLKDGSAKLKTTGLVAGTDMLTAVYSGDPKNEASTSAELKQEVKGGSKANTCD